MVQSEGREGPLGETHKLNSLPASKSVNAKQMFVDLKSLLPCGNIAAELTLALFEHWALEYLP